MPFTASEKTILIVDDEPDLREILQLELEDEGYQTELASQAHEALEILATKNIDLIVSDIRMPGGDGVLLLDSVIEKYQESIPLIFVSGFADITIEESYHKGAWSMFSKPLNTERLFEYISFALSAPSERWKKKSDWDSAPAIKLNGANHNFALGRGGCFLSIDQDLPRPAEQIHLKLEVEPGTFIEGLCICRWQRSSQLKDDYKRGVGLEFVELSAESIDLIEKTNQRRFAIPQIPMK